MTVVRPLRLGLLVCGLLVAACAATPVALIDLDNEWARTYSAMVDRDKADDLLLAADFDAQLADLSRRAETRGDAARASDAAMAVGFYRIAAAAAWKSGAHRENDVLSLRDKGVDACQALPKQDASQPRDCTFIRIVPLLALFDVKQRGVESAAGADGKFPPGKMADVVKAAGEVTGTDATPGLIGELAGVGAGAAAPQLSESFDDYVRANLKREHCAVLAWQGTLALSGASATQLDAVTKSIESSERKLAGRNVPRTC